MKLAKTLKGTALGLAAGLFLSTSVQAQETIKVGLPPLSGPI
jgi:hypothetical protein